MNSLCRTRFAPSPTGSLHLGGARTGLFAYLLAKHNHGQFLLRIEDTDQQRIVEGSQEEIIQSLRWLGLQWDEGPEIDGNVGPYVQSQRSVLYKKYANKLLNTRKAYLCFCTGEELLTQRKVQEDAHLPARYNRRCRELPFEESITRWERGERATIRCAMPKEGVIVVHDLLRGDIQFNAKDQDDPILLKSDGLPTYHLANVVDDHLMNISHVIRGEEWLPSLPKHMVLYQAFGWNAPIFVHLSVILAQDGGKMSKRRGALPVLWYRDHGYLFDAVVNFMALLGWNPQSTEEYFTREELIAKFDIANLNLGNPMFDEKRLLWMNKFFLRQLSEENIVRHIENLAQTTNIESYQNFLTWYNTQYSSQKKYLWKYIRERCATLQEIAEVTEEFRMKPYESSLLLWKKRTLLQTLEVLREVLVFLEQCDEMTFQAEKMQETLLSWIETTSWSRGEILWPLRVALSGRKQSPPPFEISAILGKDETLQRMRKTILFLETEMKS